MTQQIGQDYRQSIADLLGHYEDGWDVFKNASHWDYPLRFKDPSNPANRDLPQSWLELAEKTIGIIATQKYGLDVYENRIEVITSSQMLDAYASVGMPISYDHWSFGKQRMTEEKLYKQGKQGLAYEIVINTDPAIAYCMEGNSPLMQMLVIAHASFGHNSFFKGNHLFQQFTNAKHIVGHLEHLRDYIRACEDKYGFEEVEQLLDACHALQTHAVYRRQRPAPKTEQERKAAERKREEERHARPILSDIYSEISPKKDLEKAAAAEDWKVEGREENLLAYIAENAPHLPDWKRDIMRMIADKAQYFYPQRQTQVMNEGWASFWHYTLLNDLSDLGLVSDGMMLEFKDSHTGVLFQPDFDSPYFGGRLNPYALGFAMFTDIKRMCEDPTPEDRKFFPDIAGNGDWLGTLKFAMENFKDESFVQQYLSPKVIRDFNLFAFRDNAAEPAYEITAIQDSKGYDKIRDILSSNYRLADNEPHIEVSEFHNRSDRRLVLTHIRANDKPLADKDIDSVLKHMYHLWQHPVILKTINGDGHTIKTYSCPPKYTPPTGPQPKP